MIMLETMMKNKPKISLNKHPAMIEEPTEEHVEEPAGDHVEEAAGDHVKNQFKDQLTSVENKS